MAEPKKIPASKLKSQGKENSPGTPINVVDSLNAFRHGLRTPLNQVLGYTEMLMEDVSGTSAQTLLPDLERIHLIGGQLLALINEGLAPWKLMVGRVDLDTMRFEMRSPLNLIMGYAELCQEIAVEIGDNRLVPDLQKIIGAAKNLQNAFDSPSLKERVDRCLQGEQSKHRTRWLMEEPPEVPTQQGSILIVDDNEMNRDMLCRRLERYGYVTLEAESGQEGVEIARSKHPDLILMDVVMPGANGYDFLEQFKKDPTLSHIPVIMISALDEMEVIIRCIEIGAEDYLPKPFNPVLLKARIDSCIFKKRTRDQEKTLVDMMRAERERLEQILNGALPQAVSNRLRQCEPSGINETAEASVMLVEVVDFKALSAKVTPQQAAGVLTELSMTLDWLARFNKSDKVRFGPGQFLIISGLLAERPDHAATISDIALKLQHVLPLLRVQTKTDLQLRITMASGNVSGSVIGRASYYYEAWGEAVMTATNLAADCEPGGILLDEKCAQQLEGQFKLEAGPRPGTWKLAGRQNNVSSVAA